MEPWYYDEFKQVGVDFSSEEEVHAYDQKYKTLRNIDEEADFIAKSVNLKPESVILEFGAGTGEHAIRLARRCSRVTSCDVSKTMIEYARGKVERLGINNIEFINSGFLNRELPSDTYDAVVSQLALHHLPEFWKSVAVYNINRILKTGGIFYLLDSILSFDVLSYHKTITNIIEYAKSKMGNKIADEIAVNIRDEYPPYDWAIESILKKCGFRIENRIKYTDVMSLYVSVKE
jgi:putative AdoMet-dependent methyltransferase